MTTPEILREAADLIDAHGLWRGRGACQGQFCIMTAIFTVVQGTFGQGEDAERARLRCYEALRPLLEPLDALTWNDTHTTAEVAGLLRDAADAAEIGAMQP